MAAIEKYSGLMEYISNNLTAGLTVKKLAACVDVSVPHLSADFRKNFGLTLKRFLENQMLARAENRLMHSHRKVKEIAEELGYANEYTFSHFFKKFNGSAPSVFRKNYQKLYSPAID